MYFSIENESGEKICFTNPLFMLSKITGLSEPAATIGTSAYAGSNGSYLTNSAIHTRNIVLDFTLHGEVEAYRHFIYETIKTGQPVRCHYATPFIKAYADGYVETCEIDNFDEKTTGQISIICVDPFWYSENENSDTATSTFDGFYFPFAIDKFGIPFSTYIANKEITIHNSGSPTGFICKIDCLSQVKNPAIYNKDTQEVLKIKGDFSQGDAIEISTMPMKKYIRLRRNGIESNIISQISGNSTWLDLKTGDNNFSLIADLGDKYIQGEFSYKTAYYGV